ncbi:MAG: CocE/NonD family hydrolase [Rhizobiales bacterium]|nr:CocE/NonD family hydrolase [Hyphomicrobiales bacterium]
MQSRLVEIDEIENAFIPMRDGVLLAARIWLPADAGSRPVPAIVEYIPYRKRDETVERDESLHPSVARHGYACLRIDLRGSGDSEGVLADEYTSQEHEDCLEILAWLGRQAWCDGNVGMIGISWGGFNALQMAATAPDCLKAVIAVAATHNRFTDDIHFMGGALLTNNLTWSQKLMADVGRPPDPLMVGDRWRQMWLDRLNRERLFIEPWLEHQRYDEFWRHGSVCEDYASIRCAVLAVAGWGDSYSNFVPQLLSHLECPNKAIVGPWAHHYPHLGRPGPAIDFVQECVRWWDHWLKGIETDLAAEPTWRVYLQRGVPASPSHTYREGRWIGIDRWPPANQQTTDFHLDDGRLNVQPGAQKSISLSSPQTLGAMSGEWCPYAIDDQPADQTADDRMAVCFDTEALVEPLEILGAAVATLSVAGRPTGGIVVVRLEDVSPEGPSTRVSYGVFNLANPPCPTAFDEAAGATRIDIVLNDTAYAFAAGHRIRLAVSTAYWPTIWPSRETPRIVLSTSGSLLRLPMLSPSMQAASPVVFGQPETVPDGSTEILAAGTYRRSVTRDLISGKEILTVSGDSGIRRYKPHGLEIGSNFQETYSIWPDDPLSASLEIVWNSSVKRDEWLTRTRITTTMKATVDDFLILADLVAFEGEEEVLTRNWSTKIRRDTV